MFFDERWLAVASALALSTTMMFPSSLSSAQRSARALTIAVGETGAITDSAGLAPALRNALAAALEPHPAVELSPLHSARVVVRGSITRLDRAMVDGRAEVRCEVSLVVAERRGGSVRALLSGRARAQGTPGPRLDSSAIRAAVEGALRPLDQSVSR